MLSSYRFTAFFLPSLSVEHVILKGLVEHLLRKCEVGEKAPKSPLEFSGTSNLYFGKAKSWKKDRLIIIIFAAFQILPLSTVF